MVLSKGVKKCFGLLLVCCIMFIVSLSVYSDVNALSKDFDSFLIRYATSSSGSYQASSWLGYSTSNVLTNHTPSFYKFDRVANKVTNIPVPSGNNNLVFTEKWNFVTYCLVNPGGDYYGRCPEVYGSEQYLFSVNINGTVKEFISDDVDLYVTDWPCPSPTSSGSYLPCRTFTFQASAVVRDVSGNIDYMNVNVEFPGSVAIPVNSTTSGYFEQSESNRAIFDFLDGSGALTVDILEQQLQTQKLELQALENLNLSFNQQYQQDQTAYNNISGQTTSDIPNSTSQQTSSLIGVISSFISALQNFSATNCSLTLPFPEFVGGEKTVNVCSGKEKAPTIVAVGSSLALIAVFVPLAFIVLKMIYNEIRSWTNG